MHDRAFTCNMVNAIDKSRENKYLYKQKQIYIEGISVGFGNKKEFCFPTIHCNEKRLLSCKNIRTINDVIDNIKYVEFLFREGNTRENECLKNCASAILSRVSKVFFENFERQIKYNSDICPEITNDKAIIFLIRKYINFLVLSYRWMPVNINLFNSGVINCLQIGSVTNQERYYLARKDKNILTRNITMKVAIEVNRYLGTFNVEEATNEFIEKCLEKNELKNNSLIAESNKIDEQIDVLQTKLTESINVMPEDFMDQFTAAISKGVSGIVQLPKLLENLNMKVFISSIIKLNKLKQKKEKILKDLSISREFRELFYLHLQLQFSKKYFPNCNSIILTISYESGQKNYNIQVLF